MAKTLLPAIALTLGGFSAQSAVAQATQWQPTRLPAAPAARSLGQNNANDARFLASNQRRGSTQVSQAAAAKQNAEPQQLGGGVVLRWCRSDNAPADDQSGHRVTAASAFAPSQGNLQNSSAGQTLQRRTAARPSGDNNPLRGGVYQAAYQDGVVDPFDSAPALPNALPNAIQDAPQRLPDIAAPPNFGQADPGAPNLGTPQAAPEMTPLDLRGSDVGGGAGQDPLDGPESAPAPGMSPQDVRNDTPEPSPFRDDTRFGDDPADEYRADATDRSRMGLPSCNTMRERMDSRPLTAMKLNPSPKYGNAGRFDGTDTERARKAFADTTKVREWHDYLGRQVATGRFVDMKNNMVYIDDVGKISTIHYLDLSDRDTEYVGLAWKIPGRCGTGYEPLVERNFIPTQFQWTASGLCHKPGYFEQPQLERYGHEVGPVLQPLLSSAHFFTSIAILPYKMGIHPPNECQYSLGYIRPGNCAPYMMQPFPWSLRGAAVQAGVVTGAAALIP